MRNLSGLVLVAAAAVLAAPPGASAQEYPWCANYNGEGGGGRNCGFVSYEQCMATVWGIGGGCERNSFYRGPYVAAVHSASPARAKRGTRSPAAGQ
jgi:hypothetical protein